MIWRTATLGMDTTRILAAAIGNVFCGTRVCFVAERAVCALVTVLCLLVLLGCVSHAGFFGPELAGLSPAGCQLSSDSTLGTASCACCTGRRLRSERMSAGMFAELHRAVSGSYMSNINVGPCFGKGTLHGRGPLRLR